MEVPIRLASSTRCVELLGAGSSGCGCLRRIMDRSRHGRKPALAPVPDRRSMAILRRGSSHQEILLVQGRSTDARQGDVLIAKVEHRTAVDVADVCHQPVEAQAAPAHVDAIGSQCKVLEDDVAATAAADDVVASTTEENVVAGAAID